MLESVSRVAHMLSGDLGVPLELFIESHSQTSLKSGLLMLRSDAQSRPVASGQPWKLVDMEYAYRGLKADKLE